MQHQEDERMIREIQGHTANARFSYNPRTRMASVKAIRPIRKGEEVFVKYGSDYRWAGNMK